MIIPFPTSPHPPFLFLFLFFFSELLSQLSGRPSALPIIGHSKMWSLCFSCISTWAPHLHFAPYLSS